MRNEFIACLIEHNLNNADAYLLVGDLGYSVIEPFVDAFPDHYLNIGVAEQNMAGIASGMAAEGHRVYCYSIGNFNTFRCAEQLRNDIDYHNLPVCTVSVGGGFAYGNMGYSHHAIQDYILMRSLPNTIIFSPVDARETRLCMDFIREYSGPAYLRLHKANERKISLDSKPIIPGKPRLVYGNHQAKTAYISTGFAGQLAYDFVCANPNTAHFTMPAWSMNSSQYISDFVSGFDKVTVIEDHLVHGGFGSWILEALSGTNLISRIRLKGIPDSAVGVVGSESYLLNLAGLTDLGLKA